jgi:hypothetical protein
MLIMRIMNAPNAVTPRMNRTSLTVADESGFAGVEYSKGCGLGFSSGMFEVYHHDLAGGEEWSKEILARFAKNRQSFLQAQAGG